MDIANKKPESNDATATVDQSYGGMIPKVCLMGSMIRGLETMAVPTGIWLFMWLCLGSETIKLGGQDSKSYRNKKVTAWRKSCHLLETQENETYGHFLKWGYP